MRWISCSKHILWYKLMTGNTIKVPVRTFTCIWIQWKNSTGIWCIHFGTMTDNKDTNWTYSTCSQVIICIQNFRLLYSGITFTVGRFVCLHESKTSLRSARFALHVLWNLKRSQKENTIQKVQISCSVSNDSNSWYLWGIERIWFNTI